MRLRLTVRPASFFSNYTPIIPVQYIGANKVNVQPSLSKLHLKAKRKNPVCCEVHQTPITSADVNPVTLHALHGIFHPSLLIQQWA